MSELHVESKSIRLLFQQETGGFLIPDYQRPYAWDKSQCQTLWEDLLEFAIPDGDATRFDTHDVYFLGPLVMFKNEDGRKEIIDGQQRLTTLMLLLRAFYSHFGAMRDVNSVKTQETIGQCIWMTDEFGTPDANALKIDSEVATDTDKDEFTDILRTGKAPDTMKSRYAENYRYFKGRIEEFLQHYPTYFAYLPMRILNNCVLLPIDADSQDTALTIFSTLNDRGMPLADADIFKAQLYKYYGSLGKKDEFVDRWKALDEGFKGGPGATQGSMDELFTDYMYFARARRGITSSTTEALRKFYERDKYALLKQGETFDDVERLAAFWRSVQLQDEERFSDDALRRLFVLNYAPNTMWTYFLSVYFLQRRDASDLLDGAELTAFLDKTIAFMWAYAITNPGVNSLRSPIYKEMVNIVEDRPVTFDGYRQDPARLRIALENYRFANQRRITKAMLAWWAMRDPAQPLLSIETSFDIEHIYARKRQEVEHGVGAGQLESLGNKALLETRINIRAADYRFADKKKYYRGFVTDRGQKKEGTKVKELLDISESNEDFGGEEIAARMGRIIDVFIDDLGENDLLLD